MNSQLPPAGPVQTGQLIESTAADYADVIGIDVGISMLMAENARTNFVWNVFARNPEVRVAMRKAGFRAKSAIAYA